ncbi:MAG: chemotaxis protein CheA [Thermodesulfobacteriota bacterium]
MNDSNYKTLFIKEAKDRLEDISNLLLDIEKGVADSNLINSLFREFHSIKGMAVSMEFEDISRLSHLLEDVLNPYRVDLSSGKNTLYFSKKSLELLIEGEDALESMIQCIEEGTYLCPQDYTPLIERLEDFIAGGGHKNRNDVLKGADKISSGKPASLRLRLSPTIKVNAETLDGYINLIGELISSRLRLTGLSKFPVLYQFKEDIHAMGLLLKELYQQILTIRLLHFDNITLGLTKLVRDLLKEEAKEVEFSVRGGGVRLDRAILEQAIDPLIHILRNAVDHGIEGTEERKRFGKPQKGRIEINVSREKEGVIIEVSDDGRGIDPLKIKDKAVSIGIISRCKADELNKEEALLLTSMPGFTMAEKVTQVSGRGVGMDVVRNFVDGVGGSLRISSELHRGTRITMLLPPAISIIETLLVSICPDVFAFPLFRVKKVVDLGKGDIRRGKAFYYFSMDNKVVPVLSLRKVLRMPSPVTKKKTLNLVIVDLKGRNLGLIVDDLIGEKEVYVKPFKTPLNRIKGISGYTLIDGGRPAFLLDLNNLLRGVLVSYPYQGARGIESGVFK